MGKTEISIFFVLSTIVILVFIAGIVLFIFQYRKRKIEHGNEKEIMEKNYLQQILTTQLQSQQQTMQFIGREIHDNVGQKLTLASLYAKQLVNNSNTATEKINTIGSIIDESLADLRQLSKSLTNPALAGATLTQLLHDEAVKINSLGSCIVTVTDTAKSIQLQPAQKNILFRLLQEFIQNSLKHAGCRKIDIVLLQNKSSFIVTAKDDGQGFDALKESTGQGLANMKRRAEELEAVFTLQSGTDTGTKIIIELPLNQPDEI